MTRRLLILVMSALCVVGVFGTSSASADDSAPRTHVVCAGGNTQHGPFDGVCVWAPLPL